MSPETITFSYTLGGNKVSHSLSGECLTVQEVFKNFLSFYETCGFCNPIHVTIADALEGPITVSCSPKETDD
jgi:hypothetical protein